MIITLDGNTLRIKASFYNFADALVDPSLMKLKIYDSRMKLIHEDILGESHKISSGIYECYYTPSINELGSTMYCELYGEISTGLPILDRKSIKLVFTKE